MGEVVLLHVVDATHPSRHGWTQGPEIENARIRLAEKKEMLENSGLKVQVYVDVIVSVITEGDVAQAILETAASCNISLIVAGARGIRSASFCRAAYRRQSCAMRKRMSSSGISILKPEARIRYPPGHGKPPVLVKGGTDFLHP